MLPDKDKDALNIILLIGIISSVICAILFLNVIIFKNIYSHLLGNESIRFWLFFIPLSVFFNSIYQTFNYWLNRKEKYKVLATSRLSQTVMSTIIKISMGIAGFGIAGLVSSSILGQGIIVLILILFFYRIYRKEISTIEILQIKEQAKKYKDFPQKSMLGALMNILSWQLPFILLTKFYNSHIVGYYSLTMTILSLPMSLIGGSISQVFYQQSTVALRNGRLKELVNQTTRFLFIIILIPMAIISIYGKELFGFIFGSDWSKAGIIAQVMAPFFLIRFIFSSQSTVIMVLRRLDFEVKFNLCFLISQICGLLAGYYLFNNYIYSFIFMSSGGFVMFVVLGIWIWVNSMKR